MLVTNAVELDLGGKAVRLWIPEAADCVMLDIEGHELRCDAREIVSFGQAIVFISSCVSPKYAASVLNFDPSSEVQTRGRRMM